MLLAPLYHQVDRRIENHFSFFSQYPSKWPGDPLEKGVNFCLTFDDATSDFYEVVFPLLKVYQLKAVLAVPTAFIGKKGYCSWEQLDEMNKSGLVKIASHSATHLNLTQKGVDLDFEILASKKQLEEQLKIAVDTFVYPFGKFNQVVQQRVKKHYSYIMRIGMAYNYGWKNLIYRISADYEGLPEQFFKKRYFWFYWLNSLRGR